MPVRPGVAALGRAMPRPRLHPRLHPHLRLHLHPHLHPHLQPRPPASISIHTFSYPAAGLLLPPAPPSSSPWPPTSRPTASSSSSSYFTSPPRLRSLHTSTRQQSVWTAAVSVASNAVSGAVRRATTPKSQLDFARSIDPLGAIAKEMQQHLAGNMRKLLGSGHPSLERVAKYYTRSEGKHFRPLLVLLMSQATALCPKSQAVINNNNNDNSSKNNNSSSSNSSSSNSISINNITPATPSGIDPSLMPLSVDQHQHQQPPQMGSALPSQQRLAEITELIHTASLLHDDVIDHSESRRGSPSANLAFGNKMAVLAGDFLLGRASVALARLRNVEVVELMATAIANLVEGEFMQLKNTSRDEQRPQWSDDTLSYYLQKTYLKSASLIANSCRATAILGGSDMATADAAYTYGKNLGLAFQLVDDMLDYTRSAAELGKPAGADLELGLATAPLLFAWKQMPELGALVGRKFGHQGDVEKARELVLESDGVEQTRHLAETYRDQAVEALLRFPDSVAKDGLIEMANKALQRHA